MHLCSEMQKNNTKCSLSARLLISATNFWLALADKCYRLRLKQLRLVPVAIVIILFSAIPALSKNLCVDLFSELFPPSERNQSVNFDLNSALNPSRRLSQFESTSFAGLRVIAKNIENSNASAVRKNQFIKRIVSLAELVPVLNWTYFQSENTKVELSKLFADEKFIFETENLFEQLILQRRAFQARSAAQTFDSVLQTRFKDLEASFLKKTQERAPGLKDFFSRLAKQVELETERQLTIDRKRKEEEASKQLRARQLERVAREEIARSVQLLEQTIIQWQKARAAGLVPTALFDFFSHQKIVKLLHPEFASVSNKLLNYKWFKELSAEDQQVTFYLVHRTYWLSGQVGDIRQSLLLKNTADYIANGYFPLLPRYLIDSGGYAGESHIGLSSSTLMQDMHRGLNTSILTNPRVVDFSVEVLVHEVNHRISGQLNDHTVKYLIEEYRAYQVQFYSKNARLMTAREGLRKVLELVSNSSGLYPKIKFGFRQNYSQPEYVKFFAAFGVDSVEVFNKLSESPNELLDMASNEKPSPRLGWVGYLTNSPKPNSDRHLQDQIVSPEILKAIDKLAK